MLIKNNANIGEYQKCGQILVAARRNKFLMSCNYCQHTFKQLQAFMRHLQGQHHDQLEFVKPAKEVEVYAVEELMNQTVASVAAPDVDSEESNMAGEEDSKWLGEEDMKWLDEGLEPKGKQLKENMEIKKNAVAEEEEDSLGLANMSILKALEDCDVSFNLMDKLNSTSCQEEVDDVEEKEEEEEGEKETDLDNTLLREIQNEWEDSDSNDSLVKKIDCTEMDLEADCSRRVLDLSDEMANDVTMTEAIINSTCNEESLERAEENEFKTSRGKNIKNLLQGLEDMDDVDSFLDNLEGNLENNEDMTQKHEDNIPNTKIVKSQTKILKNKAEKRTENCKILLNLKLNNKSSKIIKNIQGNSKNTKNFSQNLEEKLNDNKLNNFEKRLMELEQDLQEDVEIVKKNSKLNETTGEVSNFAAKLKDLENLLNDDDGENQDEDFSRKCAEDFEPKTKNVANKHSSDFELQLRNLEESLNGEELDELISKKILPEESQESLNGEELDDLIQQENLKAVDDVGLNDDLTKALADALGDDDLDMLNMPADEEGEVQETLNQNILNFLDQELRDKEIEQEMPDLKEKEQKRVKITKTSNKLRQTTITSSKNNLKLKYQKTNLKAKSKLQENHTKNVLKSSNSTIHKQTKTLKPTKTKDPLIPLKGNHDIFLQQLTVNNSFNSPAKTSTIENISGKILRQKKTPNKENQENHTPPVNIKNIKKEKLTPAAASFINTNRGDKTPVKREQMFFKQSPKTQEKQEILNSNITPSRANKTPQERKLKESPKTQEKREQLETQQTPSTQRQKTPQIQKREIVKQSPKTQEKLNQTQHKDKTPTTPGTKSPKNIQQMSKSPTSNTTKSNEKRNKSASISPSHQTNTNSLKTPLTTPQRLRNVAIKLQRFTPDKLSNKQTNQETKSLEPTTQTKENNVENFLGNFKLPPGIILTKIPKENSNQDTANQSVLVETPIKPTYCQQNFSESSLETKEQDSPQKEAPKDVQINQLAENLTIYKIKKEAISSKLRQRKASIDIVPSPNLGNSAEPKQPSASKTPRHSNLDYKSYAVNRSARKKEVLQRMRHIKKQIFKSIEGGECVTKVNRLKSPLVKQQKKRKVLIENVQILPNLKKDTLTPLINPFNDFKKPFANNNSTTTGVRPNSVSPKNMPDDQKQAKIALRESSNNDSSINDDEKLIKKSLKRPASSPLLNEDKQVKRPFTTEAKEDEMVVEKSTELETTQLDLSESVVDFLQRDLRANRLNVDSFLNEEMPVDDAAPDETSMESNAKETKLEANAKDKETSSNSNLIDDILEQVDNEQKTTDKTQKENEFSKDDAEETVLDFDEAKDINLLAKFGLKVIKLPAIEEDISLEERDEMNEKANKFANIYKNWPRIWSTKNCETATIKEELDISFKQMLVETNLAFKLDLSLVELKRLANLINIWYTHNFNSKLIEKRKISDSTNRYLLIFHFIPKTIKRFYYCEYCEEYFNTEHKYFTHRITHTGALFPYTCPKCSVGFKTARYLKNHEVSCDFNVQTMKSKLDVKSSQITYEKVVRGHKCQICKEIFATSELLYEHSKEHLKTIYNCAKCELVFASAIDVQNHMTVCNPGAKRVPKQSTPRPAKQKN